MAEVQEVSIWNTGKVQRSRRRRGGIYYSPEPFVVEDYYFDVTMPSDKLKAFFTDFCILGDQHKGESFISRSGGTDLMESMRRKDPASAAFLSFLCDLRPPSQNPKVPAIVDRLVDPVRYFLPFAGGGLVERARHHVRSVRRWVDWMPTPTVSIGHDLNGFLARTRLKATYAKVPARGNMAICSISTEAGPESYEMGVEGKERLENLLSAYQQKK